MNKDKGISIEIDGIYCPECRDMHPTLWWHEKYDDYISEAKHIESIVRVCKIFGKDISIDDACKNYIEHLHCLGLEETEAIEKCVVCSTKTRFKNTKTNHYVCSNECRYADNEK